jgi:hypothetical protein
MNARKENVEKPLDTVLPDQPSDRIAELERKVTQLQTDVAMLKRVSGWPFWTHEDDELKEKRKPGPKEKIGDEELFHYRDALILWLEPVWPWMKAQLPAARTPEEIGAIFEAVARDPDYREPWQTRILANAPALFEFLSDERFRKTLPKATVTAALQLPWQDERRKRAANQLPTRQIANAMAGVPDIAWRTSLDRCNASPSTPSVALNLDMDYRELFGIPAPKDQDLTGMSCPVPKSIPPISAQPSAQAAEPSSPIKATGVESESIASEHARAG